MKAQENAKMSANISFNVQPQQCVTLRQGRDCFATIKIHWQQQTTQALCLYQVSDKATNSKEQLMCWPKENEGKTTVEFESNDNLIYQLRTQEGDRLLAETEVIVSWLHKNTTQRRRWRLF